MLNPDGHDVRCRSTGRRVRHDGLARRQRHEAGQCGHAAARAGGDRAHRLLAQHDRPGAGPRPHPVAGPGHRRGPGPPPFRAECPPRARRPPRPGPAAALRPPRRPPPPGGGRPAVERAATAAGFTLLLGDTRDDPDHEARIVGALVERRVDGLLLAPSGTTVAEHSVPVVLLDRCLDVPLDQVGSENTEPTAELVAHLAALGHTRIGMVAGLRGLATTDERIAGYRLGLERAGIAEPLLEEGGSQRDLARAAAHRLLERGPTALISGNNFMTIGILRALAERDLRVPEDIALVGFDDFEWADLLAPRLTVIAQPVAEIGARAVELLLSRLEDPEQPPRTERLAATFVHRDSCGCDAERSPESRVSPSG